MSAFDTTITDNNFMIGQQWNGMYRDRYSYQRDTLTQEAIRAWRLNPLARRLANLFKIYNVNGLTFECKDKDTQDFLRKFWNHELNQMDDVLEEISNEIFLTGNLYPIYNTDQVGMTYIRIFPTDQIADIITAQNDVRQEQSYLTRPAENADVETFFNMPNLPVFMRHHAINRLAGCAWGEGEIWPDLPWLGRYASFLEDRVRLNRYRQAFIYDITLTENDDTKVKARKKDLMQNPPQPGSVNVHGENETWQVMSPKLESGQAEQDGLQIKKMIAVNHVPLYMLAEPESSTSTTADASGTPTYKAFENHQKTFIKIVTSILKTAQAKRSAKDNKISSSAEIKVLTGDATEKDNAALALATSQIVNSIGEMFDRNLIDEAEYLRLTYRFMGETRDPNKAVPKGIKRPLEKPANASQGGLKTDAVTGNVKVPQNQ